MSLIQRNAVPLFVLLAVIAVGVGVFTSTSQFAFGEEPVGCDAAAVGISIFTTDEEGNPVTVVANGDVVSYRVTLSIPELPAGETACNYVGGSLAVTLPNGTEVAVAGTSETEEIPTIVVGSPFTAEAVSYTVSQNDAVNGELTVRANYSDGQSLSVAEGEQPPEAAASVSNVLRITPPSIAIEKITTTPVIYFGQTAGFTIKVINTGGYELSNVVIVDSQIAECNGMNFGSLAVGEEKSDSCSVLINEGITNEAYATAAVPGGPPIGMEMITSNKDTATVNVEGLSIGIIVDTSTPHVRVGNQGEVQITVIMPPQTAVNKVEVTVPEAPQCGSSWELLPAGAEETYTCVVETDPEIEGSLSLGTTTIVGTVTGSVPDVPLQDQDSTDVSVFNLALNITIDPEEQTIRNGDSADFTISVSNQGDDLLSNVIVTNGTVPDCDATFETMAPGEVQTYQCTGVSIMNDLVTTANVVATASDGAPVDASDSATVIILRPSTAVQVTSVNTMVLRLVVQTLTITETNDGDSALTNVCVEFDPTGSILPHADSTENMMMGMMDGEDMEQMEAEGIEMGEGMMESMVADPCARHTPGVTLLTRDSVEFIGGDVGSDGIMDIGETWEWRVVSVGVAGTHVSLPESAENSNFVVIGHGIDALGGDVTYPGDAEEISRLEVPIVTTH